MTYKSFRELAAAEQENRDYRITMRRGLRQNFLIAAIHGQNIEPGTSDIANDIAGDRHGFYAFDVLNPAKDCKMMHVSSNAFDEPRLQKLSSEHKEVITIHGCRDKWGAEIRLGGLDEELKEKLLKAFNAAGLPARHDRELFTGANPQNVCNQGKTHEGVQIEIPRQLRDDAEKRRQIVNTIRTVISTY